MIITTGMIMEKKPCKEYTQERIKGLVGEGKTLLELTELDIPALDRVWVITMFLDDKTNRKFAIWCARRHKIDNKKIAEHIDITEKYYDGKATKEELDTAYLAAYSGAYSAAYYTANFAANSVAYYAAYFAAYSVAHSVADCAAYRVADSLADLAANPEVEQKLQIEKLKELIGEK